MTGPRSIKRFGLRYLAVGGICALVYNLVMIAGAQAGFHYLVSLTFSFCFIVVIGYGLHTFVTFERRFSISAFARYALAMLGNYPLTVALLFVFCDLGRLPMVLASPAATAVLMAWNYVASRWAIARNPVPEPAP